MDTVSVPGTTSDGVLVSLQTCTHTTDKVTAYTDDPTETRSFSRTRFQLQTPTVRRRTSSCWVGVCQRRGPSVCDKNLLEPYRGKEP